MDNAIRHDPGSAKPPFAWLLPERLGTVSPKYPWPGQQFPEDPTVFAIALHILDDGNDVPFFDFSVAGAVSEFLDSVIDGHGVMEVESRPYSEALARRLREIAQSIEAVLAASLSHPDPA